MWSVDELVAAGEKYREDARSARRLAETAHGGGLRFLEEHAAELERQAAELMGRPPY